MREVREEEYLKYRMYIYKNIVLPCQLQGESSIRLCSNSTENVTEIIDSERITEKSAKHHEYLQKIQNKV